MPRLVVLTSSPAPSSTAFASLPWMDRNPRRRLRQLAGDRLGAAAGAVDEADLADPGIGERRHDRPRRTARAEHDRRARRRHPNQAPVAQVFAKPVDIGVAGFEAAIGGDDYRVGGPDPARQRVDPVYHPECCLLVRDRQIAAAKTQRRQRPQRLLDVFGPHRQRQIGAVDPGLVEPETMQQRREWRDRPSHDPADRPSHLGLPGEPESGRKPVELLRCSPHSARPWRRANSLRIAAAVSSIERRVTSMTGQCRSAKIRRASRTSARTASISV